MQLVTLGQNSFWRFLNDYQMTKTDVGNSRFPHPFGRSLAQASI
jgi:hypothetical protein